MQSSLPTVTAHQIPTSCGSTELGRKTPPAPTRLHRLKRSMIPGREEILSVLLKHCCQGSLCSFLQLLMPINL